MAVASLDPALSRQYVGAVDYGHTKVGLSFGYPKTAVEVPQAKCSPTPGECNACMVAAGLPEFMPQFVMSRTHAYDEINVLRKRRDVIVAYGLDNCWLLA